MISSNQGNRYAGQVCAWPIYHPSMAVITSRKRVVCREILWTYELSLILFTILTSITDGFKNYCYTLESHSVHNYLFGSRMEYFPGHENIVLSNIVAFVFWFSKLGSSHVF
jgi:hypothetical protein